MPRRHRSMSLVVVCGLVVLAPALALAANGGSAFETALAHGTSVALAATFVAGLGLSLTPCVYPMIAITVSVFGAREARSRLQAAALSASFVVGMASLFTALGVGAALTGSVFGSLLSNRIVVACIAAVFFALSASMFGAFEFALPHSLSNRLATVGGLGYGGAFALGLVSALVAAPCTGPFLTGLLLWIATTHQIFFGTAVMFTFALGLGAPFFLVGTFAIGLPKGGAWMLGVKWFFGVTLAVVALYFLKNAFPALQHVALQGPRYAVAGAAMFAAGTAAAAVHMVAERKHSRIARWSTPSKLASIPLAIVGAFLLIAWVERPKGELAWLTSEQNGLSLAIRERRPVIVDFGAEWCAACKELARYTFADARVREEAGRFVAIRIDATDDDDPRVDSLKDKYRVVGLPTVVVIDSAGHEQVRFNEFVPADRFLEAIRQVH